MFILQLTYKTAISEVDKYLSAHREYLEYYYKQGLLVMSGPRKPRIGGIIIVATSDRSVVDSFIKGDPFSLAEIADYEITEFTPIKHCAELNNLILKSEGKLC